MNFILLFYNLFFEKLFEKNNKKYKKKLYRIRPMNTVEFFFDQL